MGKISQIISQKKDLNYVIIPKYSQRFQVVKGFNTLKLYTLKALLSKS